MSSWRKSWTAYSIGLFIAWTIVLVLTWWLRGSTHLSTVALVCAGFFLGWLSSTIKVYLLKSEEAV